MASFCRGCGTPFVDESDGFCAKCGKPRTDSAAPVADRAPVAVAQAVVEQPPRAPMLATPTSGGQKRSLPVALAVLGFAVLPVMLVFGVGDCGSTEGQMQVSASPHGEWTFVPTGCASMQPYGLMGTNLHGDGHNDGAVYVTLDHVQGQRVELEVPGSCQNADGTNCTVFAVEREQCTTYDVTLDYTNTTVNDVRLVEGHVRLSCLLDDGTRVEGGVDFGGC